MINQKEIQKISNKQINDHEIYLRYAMDSFVGSLTTIKASIKSHIVDDILKKNPKEDMKKLSQQISDMVEQKIKTTIRIEFEG